MHPGPICRYYHGWKADVVCDVANAATEMDETHSNPFHADNTTPYNQTRAGLGSKKLISTVSIIFPFQYFFTYFESSNRWELLARRVRK